MKKNKFLFSIILIFMFTIFLSMLSFNAFAERQIPTVYKLTGDLNLSENAQKHNYYKLTMNIGVAQIYSGCVDKGSYDRAYEALAFQLANGVFTSPLPAQLTKGFDGQKSLPIDIKLGYSTSSTCEVGSTITLLSTTIMVPNPHFQSSNPPVPLVPDDETITYKKLKTTNAPTNNTFLKYDNDKLVWAAVEGGTGGVTYYGSSTIDIDGTNKITVRPNSIDKNHLVDFNVVSSKIGTYAVTTSKIANGAVTKDKIADKAITPIKLATTNSPAGNQNKFLKLNDEGKLMWANVSQGPPTTPITYFGSDTININSSKNISVKINSIGKIHLKNKSVDRHKLDVFAPAGQCPDDNAYIRYNLGMDRLEWTLTKNCDCYKVNTTTNPVDFKTRHDTIELRNDSIDKCVGEGSEITVEVAGEAKGWEFLYWSFSDNSIADCYNERCTFTMVNNDITATAFFKHKELPSITGSLTNRTLQFIPFDSGYDDDYNYYQELLLDKPVVSCQHGDISLFPLPYSSDINFNGKGNTQQIVNWHNGCHPNQCGSNNCPYDSNYAANICANLVDYGYDDWYLPSIDELKDLFNEYDSNNVDKGNYYGPSFAYLEIYYGSNGNYRNDILSSTEVKVTKPSIAYIFKGYAPEGYTGIYKSTSVSVPCIRSD